MEEYGHIPQGLYTVYGRYIKKLVRNNQIIINKPSYRDDYKKI